MSVRQKLEEEIGDARRSIRSDGYSMSIGELTSLYRDGELVIRPAFQRLYRWSASQKSKLIESLLLRIPIPSIFVAQDESGKWELVDGLQRVSTILEFQGELLDEEGKRKPPLKLESTLYLPSLEGVTWRKGGNTLSEAQRLDIKRAKLDLKIIERDSSTEAKYDLFQRLNAYGSQANAQEIRSAMLVAASPDFFEWVQELSQITSFITTTQLSDRLVEERFDLELVLRFLVLHSLPAAQITQSTLRNFSQFLDSRSIAMASITRRKRSVMKSHFKCVFDYLEASGGEDVFRQWDSAGGRFRGGFLVTAFEVFAIGAGWHIQEGKKPDGDVQPVVKDFWDSVDTGYSTGRSTEARLTRFLPVGRELVADLFV